MSNHFEDLNLKVDNYENIEHLIVLWLPSDCFGPESL
jgi:hypothetical protein